MIVALCLLLRHEWSNNYLLPNSYHHMVLGSQSHDVRSDVRLGQMANRSLLLKSSSTLFQ